MSDVSTNPQGVAPPVRVGFFEDFRRFFRRGLAAVMPTLITLLLLIKIWEMLWEYLGQHIIWMLKVANARFEVPGKVKWFWEIHTPPWAVQLLGVFLAILLLYIVGLIVGNFIGRTAWRLAEMGLMRIPLIRAIYPAVKQVTDFVLSERKGQLQASRVVAVRPHADDIWSLALVTGSGIKALSDAVGTEMVTVFVPSSPTAFSGYVLVVPRDRVVELPLKVEEAMRLLVTGGVSTPLPPRGDATGKSLLERIKAQVHEGAAAPPG